MIADIGYLLLAGCCWLRIPVTRRFGYRCAAFANKGGERLTPSLEVGEGFLPALHINAVVLHLVQHQGGFNSRY